MKAAIEAKSPKNLKEAETAAGKADSVKGEVKGLVSQGKQNQTKDIEGATEAAPDTSKAVAKPVTPMTPDTQGAAPAVPGAGAAPKPAPPEQVNLEAGKQQANQEMADANVSEEQLAQSNEPQFQKALADKQEAAAHADTAPGEFRAEEQQVIADSKAQAAAETQAGVAGMQATKAGALAKLTADKGATKSKDEAERARITARVQEIYAKTETEVKKTLDGIDPEVERLFNEGEAAAKQSFEAYVAQKMSAYKADRYGGWLGGLRWAKDQLLDMPEEVNRFYEAGRELYLQKMDGVISRVADFVGNSLSTAKRQIAQGKSDIASFVSTLAPNLRSLGAEAAKEIGDKFEQLESDVNAKQDSVVDTLATKYVESRKGLDERIEALQEENKGLVGKAIDGIKGVINTIRQLAAMLMNTLARVSHVVGDIIKKPVQFLGNLVAGVKGGIMKFKDNILEHLKKGLTGWLFGALAEGGVEVPEKFDLQGIIKLLISLFGLTWNNIRNRLVKQIGEKAMGAVEKGVDIFQKIASGGVGALWQMMVDKLSDIKETIMSQIKEFVVTKIIMAGVGWLIGLLNPAAAFIKACKLIYDVIMFFVTNGERIMKFVNTVIDSAADVLAGNIGGVVAKIEDVLGQMVPILIGFLASVLGLGGIGQKIREILEKLQKPVNKALDFVIKQGFKIAAPIIRLAKGIGGKVKAGFEKGKKYVKGKVEAGKKYVKGKVDAGKKWVKGKAEAGKKWARAKLQGGDDSPEGKQARLDKGMRAADSLLARRLPRDRIEAGLGRIKSRYGMASLTLVMTGHRSGEDVGHVEGKVNPEARSEDRQVPRAYESIDHAEKRREKFSFGDDASHFMGTAPQLKTIVEYWEGPNKKGQGHVVNAFDAKSKELIMKEHFLDQIPSEKRWIEKPDVPIVPGRGTRLITYVNLRQIRRFEKYAEDGAVKAVKDELRRQGMSTRLDPAREAELRKEQKLYGAIKHVTLDTVENIPALLQLHRAMLRPGVDVNKAIMATSAIPYVSLILAQVGGRIKSAIVSDGEYKELGELMGHYERRAPERLRDEKRKEHEKLLAEYKEDRVTRETKILSSFDVRLEIEPIPAGATP